VPPHDSVPALDDAQTWLTGHPVDAIVEEFTDRRNIAVKIQLNGNVAFTV